MREEVVVGRAHYSESLVFWPRTRGDRIRRVDESSAGVSIEASLETVTMRTQRKKNLRLVIARFRELTNRSGLDPELKHAATVKFTAFIRAMRRDDRRGAIRALDDLIPLFLKERGG